MKFSRLYLNRLQNQRENFDAVVVVDVLRSFTTAAIALARGASRIYPVEGVASARALCSDLADAVSIGALPGGDPAPGFDFGNSPAEIADADFFGRPVVMCTAAGVAGLQRFAHASGSQSSGSRSSSLYAAGLSCARATADAIRRRGAESVCFVITGEWVDRDGDEDVACADYLQELLRGRRPDPGVYARRVRQSDFGRRFAAGTSPHLPAADLDLAVEVDRFPFAMPVLRSQGRLLIRREDGDADC